MQTLSVSVLRRAIHLLVHVEIASHKLTTFDVIICDFLLFTKLAKFSMAQDGWCGRDGKALTKRGCTRWLGPRVS